MSFSDIIKPRKEVLTGTGVSSIVDLENLRDSTGKRLEARAADFLALTYPTSDARYVIQNLHERFSTQGQTAGLYLFEGYKGSGKSHLLLLIHHLASDKAVAGEWLAKHGLECNLPTDPVIITHKFTDFPLDAAWDLIFKGCGHKPSSSDGPPDLDELRAALEGKHVFLVLDELERGIQSIPDAARRTQNLNFLQMITEEAQRTDAASITVFASIYDAAREPGATLKRVPRIDVKFSDPEDRTKIVLHRLFEDVDAVEKKSVEGVVASFRNDWNKKGFKTPEDYAEQLTAAYPFSPELIHLIQEEAREHFQGTRGALGFLGALVKNAHKKRDLITTADAVLTERSITSRLIDLDPGSRIMGCARSDYDDLQDLPFAERIVSSVLLSTLAAAEKGRGQTEETITRQVLQPGDDITEFMSTLRAFHKLGTYFHEQEGVYYFDAAEKPHAKVEYKSLGVEHGKALGKAFEFWTGELFGDREAVVFREAEQAKAELRTRDSKRPRFVLAPRQLSPEERHDLYFGIPNRNLVVLLEPRAKDFNALENQDIVKWAQRYIAATDLQTTASTADRKRQFEKIGKDDKDYILRAFKNAGLSFVAFQQYGEKPSEDVVEVEPLGNVYSMQDVRKKIRDQFFPVQLLEEHLRDHLGDYQGNRVRQVEQTYKETLGYPIVIFDPVVREALVNLCKEKTLGLRHERDSACGRKPQLSEAELADAVIEEPFEDPQLSPGLDFTGNTPPADTPLTEGGGTTGEAGDGEQQEIDETASEPVYIETSFARGVGELRQQVAVRLAEYEDAEIRELVFRIYYEKKNSDLGSLPSGIRGSLSGMGDITTDLTVSKRGSFSKAEVEQIVESLPSFPEGDYKAEIKAVLPQEEAV